MRVLFASGTAAGGAAISTRQLATGLAAAGQTVCCVMERQRGAARFVYDKHVDLSVRLGKRRPAALVDVLSSQIGRVPRRTRGGRDGPAFLTTSVLENGVRTLLSRFHPDIVVANSLERLAWRRIRHSAARHGVPCVLYLREESALDHLVGRAALPDLLIANSQSLTRQAQAMGQVCRLIPSVVDVADSLIETSRRTALLINPIPSHGVDVALGLAALRPDVPFILQQSWPMSRTEETHLRRAAATLPNVRWRPHTDSPAEVFRDARVLLLPHRVDNRPRVVVEAQANGIPILASDLPGLAEVVGPGGRLVAVEAPVQEWAGEFAAVWDDPKAYWELSAAAVRHGTRAEAQPASVVAAMEDALSSLLADGREQRSHRAVS